MTSHEDTTLSPYFMNLPGLEGPLKGFLADMAPFKGP